MSSLGEIDKPQSTAEAFLSLTPVSLSLSAFESLVSSLSI